MLMVVCSSFASAVLKRLLLRSCPYRVFGDEAVDDGDRCDFVGELEYEDELLGLAVVVALLEFLLVGIVIDDDMVEGRRVGGLKVDGCK